MGLTWQFSPPHGVLNALERLWQSGFEAYLVGGCVRDALLGEAPKDYDITTAATPEQMKQVFAGEKLLETGLAHGTLTLLTQDDPMEITTFRTEGGYADHRHPDSVAFVTNLREDLSRRDFTINAMAWSPTTGLVDLFGGRQDLEAGVLKCVGEPLERFEEDALRMLRLLRFAARWDFQIDPLTAEAVNQKLPQLHFVATERLAVEWLGLLAGPYAHRVLRRWPQVVFLLLPELKEMVNCPQNNPYHCADVWEHTLRVVANLPQDGVLRLAGLLHDAGKPASRTTDDNGIDHFRGHPAVSAEISDQIMSRLRMSKAQIARVHQLVFWHDLRCEPSKKGARTLLARVGEAGLADWFALRKADTAGQNPAYFETSVQKLKDLELACATCLAEADCFSLKQLAINGDDLLAIGYPAGKMLGDLLNHLLEQVVAGALPNQRETLLQAAADAFLTQKSGQED